MEKETIIQKIKRRGWSEIRNRLNGKIYLLTFRSYWHCLFINKKTYQKHTNYFTSRPNPGAGIGHQMANWIAGYWWAKQFELTFCHFPFSTKEWDNFLGFGSDEILYDDLIRSGFKKVLLPLFDENNENELQLTKDIIASYSKQKVVFITEQDQFYKDQFGVMDDLKWKFYNAQARKNDHLIYNPTNFNIAIHVRRGDIVVGQANKNPNLLLRWQDNDYFKNVLTNTLLAIKTDKPIAIYLFSQGTKADFKEFEEFDNLHFCLDMNPQDSFLHLVFADLLITSKSSFSYKPALMNNGIKICPRNFWHGYPDTKDWILVENDGSFDVSLLDNRRQTTVKE